MLAQGRTITSEEKKQLGAYYNSATLPQWGTVGAIWQLAVDPAPYKKAGEAVDAYVRFVRKYGKTRDPDMPETDEVMNFIGAVFGPVPRTAIAIGTDIVEGVVMAKKILPFAILGAVGIVAAVMIMKIKNRQEA